MKHSLVYPVCDRSPLPQGFPYSCLKPLLIPVSWLYYLGIKLRSLILNYKKPSTLSGMVVSVGNLTTGGTGKTPAVIMLAQWALQAGYRPAILSRGYGGRYHETILEVTDGIVLKSNAAEAGDEPCLMAEKLRGVPIVLSAKRFLAGQWSQKQHNTNFFILDDGFQHRALKRNFDLVLLDAKEPFHNGHLLPRGLLREPISHLKRAQALIITRADRKPLDQELELFLKSRFPEKPVFKSVHVPDRIVFTGRREDYGPEYLQDKQVAAFAGIAEPEAFKTTLRQLEAGIISFQSFADHHPFRAEEIQALAAEAEKNKADFLITTEKDWMRIKNLDGPLPDLAYLSVQFRLLGDEQLFFSMLKNKAKEIIGY
ncbi:MAG: tetraacyldisaccharide 4'-kinase [Desulfobacteraceae bacterium]|nr:MAG: tetraacyldisaccharide 4'-kinase [Desulfobacteraceae bacterium]